MSYKATPSPLPATGAGINASTSTGVQPSAHQNTQYQGYAGNYVAQQGTGYSNMYAQRLPQTVMDDYERWYTESSPSNRMLLSLRSGLDSEVSWALERLCRLSYNEQFTLSSIPGLADALFEWPEWFLSECGHALSTQSDGKVDERQRRHALEALFVLRNAAVSAQNAAELSAHPKTRPLLVRALIELDLDTDESTQFVLYALELLQSLAGTYVLPPPKSSSSAANLVPALETLANDSSNRAIIISTLTALTTLFNLPQNIMHNTASSPALTACIRFLPLFQDSALVDACINFLYAHLSHPPMTKAFLLHPDMPNVVKLLVGYIISQQVEETTTIDITASSHTVPAVKVKSIDHDLTSEELERIGALHEPERCFEWLRTELVANPDEELTQVEFWNTYKDHFTRFQDRHPLLVASDVIKNASIVYTNAVAMVLPGPPQKFIIRGITKRKELVIVENNVCQWNRSACSSESFKSPEELHAHVRSHLDILRTQGEVEASAFSCAWATCQHNAPSFAALVPHVWTHLPLKSVPQPSDPAQLPRITLASSTEPYPIPDATQRAPPPPPKTVIAYPAPARDPPSGALTALLVLRTLFRASFASADAAPRVDADHFGFPGVVEEQEELDGPGASGGSETEAEKEGERRGRRAFIGVRFLMEGVRIRDPALMGWVHEMVVAGMTGTQ
ncbi:hypothetical protein M0805_004121 [Coniferiporia weirii]|nr:hypothetical protein M0805_004121 [Coniferiporia weirii]